jgi:hypothetical protein
LGIGSRLPLSGQLSGTILSSEGTALPLLERPTVGVVAADAGYFRALGITLHDGRLFDDTDRGARQVAAISESVAARAWPGRRAVGQRFRFGRADGPWIEVIGVVRDVRGISLTDSPTLDVYLPYWQSDMSLYSDHVAVVLKADDVRPIWRDVRPALRDLDPGIPIPALLTMGAVTTASVVERRFGTTVMIFIAMSGVFLAAIGIYGVAAQSVTQQIKEISIRLALGARTLDVWRLVGASTGLAVGVGIVIGGIAALLAGQLLRAFLVGVSAHDLSTMAFSAAVLGIIGVVAISMPVRRASRTALLDMLRGE